MRALTEKASEVFRGRGNPDDLPHFGNLRNGGNLRMGDGVTLREVLWVLIPLLIAMGPLLIWADHTMQAVAREAVEASALPESGVVL